MSRSEPLLGVCKPLLMMRTVENPLVGRVRHDPVRNIGPTNHLSNCPDRCAYADRYRTEGKTDREIRRCLKRYLARRFYRHLSSAATAIGVDGI
ncbi:hypothetical protein [Streptomyces sp. NPDC090080]|uniref:hypothetical protein n=1 Tax=Streptomyces sp. NPDC090080 TaxID=3365939 RepID=UPI0038031090